MADDPGDLLSHFDALVGSEWLDDDRFYFSTSRTSVKARNLAANPRCVVCPSDGEEAVIVEGVAAELNERERLATVAQLYHQKYDWDLAGQGDPLWVVRPRVVFGQIEETFTKSATRWQFDE